MKIYVGERTWKNVQNEVTHYVVSDPEGQCTACWVCEVPDGESMPTQVPDGVNCIGCLLRHPRQLGRVVCYVRTPMGPVTHYVREDREEGRPTLLRAVCAGVLVPPEMVEPLLIRAVGNICTDCEQVRMGN